MPIAHEGRLAEARARCVASLAEYNDALTALRAVCPHDKVAESPHIPETVFSDWEPPCRICETCGIEERGYQSEPRILSNPYVRRVTREERWSLRKRSPLT